MLNTVWKTKENKVVDVIQCSFVFVNFFDYSTFN